MAFLRSSKSGQNELALMREFATLPHWANGGDMPMQDRISCPKSILGTAIILLHFNFNGQCEGLVNAMSIRIYTVTSIGGGIEGTTVPPLSDKAVNLFR